MSNAVIETGRDGSGNTVTAGRYVMHQDGRMVLLQRHIPMKRGMRLATEQEVRERAAKAKRLDVVDETKLEVAQQVAKPVAADGRGAA